MLELLLRLFSEPAAIDERCLASAQPLLVRLAAGETVDPDAVLAALRVRPSSVIHPVTSLREDDDGPVVVGSTAVIRVWGLLDRTDPMRMTWDGPVRIGTGYERVQRDTMRALGDESVRAIVYAVDSPGGFVRGVQEAAGAIAEAAAAARKGGKPVIVVAPDLMASGALWLGSQADKVYAGPGAWVGSLGVRLQTIDVSEWLSRWGVKVNTIKSGEFKDLGSPFRPMTDRDRAVLQAEVDAYFGQFKSAVGAGRSLAGERLEAVATGQGFIGARAVEVGLADALRPSLSAVLAELNASSTAGRRAAAAAPTTAPRSHAMEPKAENQTTTPTTTTEAPKAPDAAAIAADAARLATDALRVERERVTAIESTCAPYRNVPGVEDLRVKSITGTATAEHVAAQVLKLVAAHAEPVGVVDVSVGSTGRERERLGTEAALLARMAPGAVQTLRAGGEAANRLASAMGYASPQAFLDNLREAEGNGIRSFTLFRIVERAAAAAAPQKFGRGNLTGAGYQNDVLASGFGLSSSDLPLLLSNVANKRLMAAFAEQTTTWQRWCAVGEARDFKSRDLVTLSELPNLSLAQEGQPLKEAAFNERKEAIQLATYGRKFSITREAVLNDDLGGIGRTLQGWGVAARRTPEILVYGLLVANAAMADGDPLFHANHKNLAGTPAALGMSSLTDAVTAMKRQQGFGPDKAPLDVRPEFLLVPSELWATALKLTTSVIDPTANNTNSAVPNVIRALGITALDTPYLPGTGTPAWYLVAGPGMYPVIEVDFLNGNQNPIVTPVGTGSIRGQEFEIIFDVGAKTVQFEGGYKNAGA